MVDHTKEIDEYLKKLFPITRSITGEGNRETLRILQEIIPLKIGEYPFGQKVYDWTIPKEWSIKDAWIKNSRDERIVDLRNSNLHVVSYSVPINKKMKLDELKDHLYFLEDLPEAIPYRTSYYKEEWGFCLSFNDFKKYFSDDEEYEVVIDSELKDGSLTYGEFIVEGKSKKEILISTYICHPSMVNDNLSGSVMTAFLARQLLQRDLKYSYRFVFIPETIGAVSYCANNEDVMKKIDFGLVVTCVGGPGTVGYKESFQENSYLNDLVEEVFKDRDKLYEKYPFSIRGSDERQYSSQGFRINCVSICKDKYHNYKYYHTSLDNLDFVKPEYINESLGVYLDLINKLEEQIYYKSTISNCEVMLGKYDLYPKLGGSHKPKDTDLSELDIILWVLFYCDGINSVNCISKKIGISKDVLSKIAEKLKNIGILERL